jgi:hypothetical protein
MRFLKLQAYCALIQFDVNLARSFSALHEKVRSCQVRPIQVSEEFVQKICAAVDIACTWYWKEVFCLHRSAATVCLLRQNGVNAQLVIGAQTIPFKAHAWVEVEGRVINDKPYMPEIYTILDRC